MPSETGPVMCDSLALEVAVAFRGLPRNIDSVEMLLLHRSIIQPHMAPGMRIDIISTIHTPAISLGVPSHVRFIFAAFSMTVVDDNVTFVDWICVRVVAELSLSFQRFCRHADAPNQ
jgi:hypothetical protein